MTPGKPGDIVGTRPGGGHGGGPATDFGVYTPPRSPDGYAIPTTPPPPDVPGSLVFPGRGEPPSTPGFFGSIADPSLATKARIAYAGTGNLAVVAETNNGIYLHSYGITQSKTVVLRDTEFVGEGTDARVLGLHATLIIIAHRTETGMARVRVGI